MKIADREIGLDGPPYVIAELGVNHDGALDRALQLTEAAHRTGADAIKLQLYKTEQLLSNAARLAAYQEAGGASDPFDLLRQLELDLDSMNRIVGHAKGLGLHAIVTIFSLEMVADARQIEWDAFKTASPDMINRPLLIKLMKTNRPLIISTGASTREEVARTADWLGDHPHVLMHCVSAYPTKTEDAALGGRLAMLEVSSHALGYSDHTTDLDTGALAVASGACILEKHLTYDRAAKGPDHAASLEPEDFARYVDQAHRAATMRGPIYKRVLDVEHDVARVSRQSLTTTGALPKGHVLTRGDLTIKRPGSGLEPHLLDDVLGRMLAVDVAADEPLRAEHLW